MNYNQLKNIEWYSQLTQDSHDKNSFHDLHVFVNIDILY